jgi:4-hydroxythreonine-4-phosphate dehydrogenase
MNCNEILAICETIQIEIKPEGLEMSPRRDSPSLRVLKVCLRLEWDTSGGTFTRQGGKMKKARIGLLLGDPSGIGPEVVAKLLAWPECFTMAEVIIIGAPEIYREGARAAQQPDMAPRFLPVRLEAHDFPAARANAESGRYVLSSIEAAVAAFKREEIDAIVFAPFNKQAMSLAGLQHDDELHYFAELFAVPDTASEINVCGPLWTSRVTSHVPFKNISGLLGVDKIIDAILLLQQALCNAGITAPRIAVAALNPHAGEGGMFGSEEQEIIRPAIEEAKKAGIDASGPWPADTLFVSATRGKFDGVVTMYHDQGQIALKLLGFDRGVTVHAGLPCPVTTPAHGTAFDIVGTGAANAGAMKEAFTLACRMAVRSRE